MRPRRVFIKDFACTSPMGTGLAADGIADFRMKSALVGREQEIGVLWSHFTAAAAGAARVVWLSGEPSVGTTRLLAAFAERVARAAG